MFEPPPPSAARLWSFVPTAPGHSLYCVPKNRPHCAPGRAGPPLAITGHVFTTINLLTREKGSHRTGAPAVWGWRSTAQEPHSLNHHPFPGEPRRVTHSAPWAPPRLPGHSRASRQLRGGLPRAQEPRLSVPPSLTPAFPAAPCPAFTAGSGLASEDAGMSGDIFGCTQGRCKISKASNAEGEKPPL